MAERITPSAENDVDSKKEEAATKSKKKSIGSLAVEAPMEAPSKPEMPEPSIIERLLQPAEKADKPEASEAPADDLTPEEAAEIAETPEDFVGVEEQDVTSQLAKARHAELGEVAIEAEPIEAEVVDHFLAATEATGDAELAYADTMAEYGIAETAETSETPETPAELPLEGELPLDEAQEIPLSVTPPAAAAAGGAGQPPRTRTPAGSFFSGVGGGARAGASPNSGPATVTTAEAIAYGRSKETDGLIIGGIVGYLIGRRRGRIKTEKKLVPVQRKLEKKVKTLQGELQSKETQLRQAVRQQSIAERAPTQPKFVERRSVERPARTPEKQRAIAAVPPERIGKVLIAAEAAPRAVTRSEHIKRAEALTRAELISISEKIVVEGTPLRRLHENGLISEKGLRRLVAEHFAGGNIQRALTRELVEREIDFERDPRLRDLGKSVVRGGRAADSKHRVLMQAGALAVESLPKAPPKKADATTQKADKQPAKKQQNVLADVSLLTVIIVLVIAIIALLMRG